MTMEAARYRDLADRGVLITGGASGIGAALVAGFVAQGARVAFIDIDEAAGVALASQLSGTARHDPLFFAADLTDTASLKPLVDRIVAILGGLKVLVNNAARDDRHALETISETEWDASLAINLKPLPFMAQAAAPHLKAGSGGAIVNFSSIAFLLNMDDLPAYSAAKAGIVGLTKSLAGRLGPDGIRVNALLPGMVVTERQKALWLTEDSIAAMIGKQCLKRSLMADDMVGPCLFLASDSAAALTAQAIIVDGGVL
ncbi:3-oxoacyl-ACP reductase [Xaviernesmea oryzae]|uniref:3-oxoacyl-ACP reductase n=1 Tax=Xaviernesmea oryzae TaxID=464029 RepID=A0A1Q9ATJ2_9HYPH|nr:SDR family oxidoreductase [Xaviernesmea oryzae]OLP58736.1 3-oxoacyl-ACP reductase [Xaviernesmea oryzae]SEK70718.1 NAD(P)-dependent dehydrogenase, short-chain alcohol dehydrogenase family [Xaviernesmea oryzae]